MVCASIQAHTEALDAYRKEKKRENSDDENEDGDGTEAEPQGSPFDFMQLELRSLRRPVPIARFVAGGAGDPAFSEFPKALATCLRDIIAGEHLDQCLREGTLPRGLPPIPYVQMDDAVSRTRIQLLSIHYHFPRL